LLKNSPRDPRNPKMRIPSKGIEYLIDFWNRVKAKAYTMLLSPCFFAIGKKTTIIPHLRFANLSLIQLGKEITIHRNCWIQAFGSKDEFRSPKIIIMDYAGIGMNATISAAKSIVIEERVFTGGNVYISDHGHEFRDIKRPIGEQGIRKVLPVRIGANSWLGQNSVILPGVTIGKHCVIGANSVVNSDIPDYCVAAGVPAKVIQKYSLSKSCWERIE
jgi:acetyltransferase-like isoleucine patch superfamily enzyme